VAVLLAVGLGQQRVGSWRRRRRLPAAASASSAPAAATRAAEPTSDPIAALAAAALGASARAPAPPAALPAACCPERAANLLGLELRGVLPRRWGVRLLDNVLGMSGHGPRRSRPAQPPMLRLSR